MILFLGRFQPFHNGHLQVVEKALADIAKSPNKNDRLIIGIGSTQYNYTPENPFTIGERIQMVEAALQEAEIPHSKYQIIPIPNIENYALWPYHVQLSVPPFEKIYTGSKIVKQLFEDANKNLANPYHIIFMKKELEICSTDIRKLIRENKKWEHLVPKNVTALIKNWNGVERIKSV